MNLEEEQKKEKKDGVSKIQAFFLFRNLVDSYKDDKNKTDDERTKIKKYGVVSMILSTIALVISLSCVLSKVINIDFLGISYVLVLIIYFVGGGIISLVFSVYGFVFGTMQVRLNRKAVGVLGIVISTIAGLLSVFLVVLIFI